MAINQRTPALDVARVGSSYQTHHQETSMKKIIPILFAGLLLSGCASGQSIPSGYERANTPHKHGISITDENVRRGEVAERYEVRHGDCGGKDCIAGTRYRSEIMLLKNKTKARFNKDIWYGWSFYNESIPKFDDKVNIMPVIGQWKMGGDTRPAVKITYQGWTGTFDIQLEDMRVAKKWGRAEKHGHICNLFTHGQSYKQWTDIVINTNWGTNDKGYLKVWINGDLKCDYVGQIVSTTTKFRYPGPNHRRGIFVSYTKRWDKHIPEQKKPTMVVYYDEFLVGKSKQDVDTRLREKLNIPAKD